jgi:hypothetical protein
MRTLFLTVALLAFGPAASACDVCGCSIGGNYFGILPQFHRHFVGIRYSTQSFQSATSRKAAQLGNFHSNEQFQTLDVLGRFYPTRRLQMLGLAPYHDFRREENGISSHSQGLGDVSILGNYIILDTGDSLRRNWQHTMTLGGGVKLPTGQHSLKNSEGELLLANMQPGTGSTDFMLSATYTLRRGAWGLATDVLGRLNTANHHDYHFGNRVSGSAKIFLLEKPAACFVPAQCWGVYRPLRPEPGRQFVYPRNGRAHHPCHDGAGCLCRQLFCRLLLFNNLFSKILGQGQFKQTLGG